MEEAEFPWSTKGGRIMEFRDISFKNIAYMKNVSTVFFSFISSSELKNQNIVIFFTIINLYNFMSQ
jgi:hypothetical protein